MSATSLFVKILIVYAALQAFFIAFVALRSQQNRWFRKFFAALLVIEGIILLERLLVETNLIHHAPHLLGIGYPISFLKPPFLFFMALSISSADFRNSKPKYLHYIPFGAILLMNLPFYFMSGPEKMETVAKFMNQIPSYQSFEFYFTLSFFIYMGAYLFASIRTLNQFKIQVTNNALVNWYRLILMAYSWFLAFHLIYYLIQPLGQFNFALINQISMLAMAFMIQAIAFKLLDQSAVLNTKIPDLSNVQKRLEYEQLILEKFETDQVYLDDQMSIQKFATLIAVPTAQVSEIINQKFNCSFKKLLNRYRIEEAKRIINGQFSNDIKLIDIAFQSGFSNKVSFYRAFKEFDNCAPSDYLEKVKKQEKLKN